jgi:lipopolysaccharide biosynthesis glycosyltransferase
MEERRDNLVYYTIGFNPKYLDLLYMSIQSLRSSNDVDIMVICDVSLIDHCTGKLSCFKNIFIQPCKSSVNVIDASMKKLLIFDYDISKYSNIMYIDSDILVDLQLEPIFSKIVSDKKLYAFAEHKEMLYHRWRHFSLLNYTNEDYDFFYKNKIYVFNCGLFAFKNTSIMKEHFANILDMISNHTGDYFCYEQPFMNVYFNKGNLVDTNVINEQNCLMNLKIDYNFMKTIPIFSWSKASYRNKIFHFSFTEGGDEKFKAMTWWKSKFFR